MPEKYFRNKITWLTFFFSILVIWVHSYNAVLFLGNTGAGLRLDMLERFLGNRVGQIAVPGFFLMSSYLFFRNFTLDRLPVKWNSRTRSVLVPYILWNFIYYLGYIIGSRIPMVSEVIGKGKVSFTFTRAADAILNYTYNYVFWYLYQLILLILLAPLIYLLTKRLATAFLFLTGILAAVYMGAALPFLNLDALFYYAFGAFAAIHGKNVTENGWNQKRFGAGIALFFAAFLIMKGGVSAAAVMGFRLLVPVGLWLAVPEKCLGEARGWMKQNFFLYAVHFAMVRLINKTGALLLPAYPAVSLGLFLIMPAICVFFSFQIGRFLRKFLPILWQLLNGGR